MGETPRKRYRKFTARQRTELVLASLPGQTTFAEICRGNDIADSLLTTWRHQFVVAGAK